MSNATHHIYFREKAEIFCDEENTCSTLTMFRGAAGHNLHTGMGLVKLDDVLKWVPSYGGQDIHPASLMRRAEHLSVGF